MTNLQPQQNAHYFDPQKARKATKIESLYAEIEAVKGLNRLQKEQIGQLSDLVKLLVEKFAGMGIKFTFKGGQAGFEVVK